MQLPPQGIVVPPPIPGSILPTAHAVAVSTLPVAQALTASTLPAAQAVAVSTLPAAQALAASMLPSAQPTIVQPPPAQASRVSALPGVGGLSTLPAAQGPAVSSLPRGGGVAISAPAPKESALEQIKRLRAIAEKQAAELAAAGVPSPTVPNGPQNATDIVPKAVTGIKRPGMSEAEEIDEEITALLQIADKQFARVQKLARRSVAGSPLEEASGQALPLGEEPSGSDGRSAPLSLEEILQQQQDYIHQYQQYQEYAIALEYQYKAQRAFYDAEATETALKKHRLESAIERDIKGAGSAADWVKATGSKQPMMTGDWICPTCGNHNFARKWACSRYSCNELRPPIEVLKAKGLMG